MDLNYVLESVLAGNCTLFTGAGFSFGALNIHKDYIIGASKLTEKLYQDCEITENDNDLKNASQFFIEAHGEHKLIDLLRNYFTISEVSDSHITIAEVSWKRVYTTNYDNVLELAYNKSGKLLSPIVLNDRINLYKNKKTISIHLNGFIERLTPSSLYSDFKLTDVSYLTNDFLNSEWVDLFRSDIETSRLVVFIGFSLNSDLDLSRIISAQAKKEKIAFIVKENESVLLTQKLSRFGYVFPIGTDGFAEQIKIMRESYSPPENETINLKSFVKYEVGDFPMKIKDSNLHDLFYKGDSNINLIHNSLTNPQEFQYYIKREEVDEIIAWIEAGGKNVLVHSDLGNGKTLFLDGLAISLTNLQYNVYRFEKYFDQTEDEIEYLCTKVSRCVLIIEKYSDHLDILKKIALFRTKDVLIIVSDRSTINDTIYITLEKTIFNTPYFTRNLNKLSELQASNLSKILTTYGLWGRHASSEVEKRKIIVDTCKSSFKLLLLHLLSSPDIKNRYNKILDFIENANESYFNATLLVLTSNIFDFQIDIDKLTYVLDDELLYNPSFNNNDYLKEFINFGTSKINVKSSILALSILSQPQYHQKLIKLLIKIFLKLDKRSSDRNNYQILKSLVSFSRLQSVFNLDHNSHFRAVVLSFYEEVKDTKFASKNPFFWLQYAIARLSAREYPVADKYFATAYSFASKNEDFDTFQIDNHFARHILENEIYNGSPDTAMEQFLKAHALLSIKSTVNENRHYPLRVAANYGKFYDRYFNMLIEQDKKVFLISCKEIKQKIMEYKSSVEYTRWNKSVIRCENEIDRIFTKQSGMIESINITGK